MLVNTIIIIIATALLTSITTLAAGYYIFEKRIKIKLEQKIDESITSLGDTVEEKVRQGVLNGISSIPSREVLRGTTRTMAKTGAEIVEDGLKTILGKKPVKKVHPSSPK
ncbi:MAG: hypothetical protein KUG82_12130 [Pseudomonadales bacterium]|nr:hypothetical protein [Pseudomonadales bacterium]